MDPNFVLRHDRKPSTYRECQIRRDPNFIHQLYFFCATPMGANKYGLYFSQAVAASSDPLDQSVRTADFLKRKRTSQLSHPDVQFALDELAAKFYLGFGQNPNDRPETTIVLRIFDLDFDPADHLGYRRIRVRGGDCQYTIKPTPHVKCVQCVSLDLCPTTGKLFSNYAVLASDKLYSALAEIEEPKENDSVLRAKLSGLKFETQNAFRCLKRFSSVFSKLDHLLLFYGFHDQFMDQSEENVFICSYDTRNQNWVRQLAFNPADFVRLFFPGIAMILSHERSPSASDSEVIGHYLNIVGHIHKYVLFRFRFYILAVKWPRNWYTGQRLPPVQHSRVIDFGTFVYQQSQDRACYETDISPCAVTLSTTHLYMVFRFRHKPYETRRLALSPKFKDYRHCANCGEVEERKRRNKDGKRIAKYKVCRLCKTKNFHLFYLDPEIACHYCSDECQKKHWKMHKVVHKRGKLNRKTGSAKTVEEKF